MLALTIVGAVLGACVAALAIVKAIESKAAERATSSANLATLAAAASANTAALASLNSRVDRFEERLVHLAQGSTPPAVIAVHSQQLEQHGDTLDELRERAETHSGKITELGARVLRLDEKLGSIRRMQAVPDPGRRALPPPRPRDHRRDDDDDNR